MLGGAAFAVCVGVAGLDLTSFEQGVSFSGIGGAISTASPSQSNDRSIEDREPPAEASATQTLMSWVGRCSVLRRR